MKATPHRPLQEPAAPPSQAGVQCFGGVIGYDGECAFCTGMARRFEPLLGKRGFQFAPLPRSGNAAPDEMRLRFADGRELGGADAVVALARRIWWAWPLFAFAQLPGALPLLRAGYRKFAANRHCLNGACRVAPVAKNTKT